MGSIEHAMIEVWDRGVRAFHWLLVLAVATAARIGFFGPLDALTVHVLAGATAGTLVLVRLVWGFTGSTYARFATFVFRPGAVWGRARELLTGRHLRYLGHNPLGGAMVLALLAVLAVMVATGIVTLGGVDKQGPLAFATTYATGQVFRKLHQLFAYLLVAMICGHLAGVAYETLWSGDRLIFAMLTGEKADVPGTVIFARAAARPVLGAAIVLFLLVVTVLGVIELSALPALGVPKGPLDPTYAKECGSCHMAYPPSLAPRSRWTALLAHLDDHFGEDASLDPATNARILAYLTENAAETADTRVSRELAAAGADDPLRLTSTPFWRRTHREIPEAVFKSKAVGAKGACIACHRDAMTARFDPQSIAIPETAQR
jgi:cytochrome b